MLQSALQNQETVHVVPGVGSGAVPGSGVVAGLILFRRHFQKSIWGVASRVGLGVGSHKLVLEYCSSSVGFRVGNDYLAHAGLVRNRAVKIQE